MADEQQANALSAAFPAPPPFYTNFTSSNVKRLEEARAAASSQESAAVQDESGVDAALRAAPDLPRDLRCLIPPEIPQADEYRSFGETFNLVNPLPPPPPPASDIPNLSLASLPQTPHAEIQPTLLRLSRSLLLSFLELVSLLAADPAQAEGKLRDIETLFGAAHTLVNEYRPHQARETLIELLEQRIATGKREMLELESKRRRVEEVLAGLGSDTNGQDARADHDAAQDAEKDAANREKEREQRILTALDAIEVPGPS